MYADLEEARARRGRARSSRSSDLEIEKSARHAGDDEGPRSREKELAEQLRKRAQASRAGHHDDSARGRRRSSTSASGSSRASSPARSPSRSQSRSRSHSRDTVRSRNSYRSKRSAARADEEAEERRKRRRGEDVYRRDRDRADDDEEERARERRRRRSDRRDDYRDGDVAAVDHRRPSPAPSSSRADRDRDRDRYDSYYDGRRYDRGSDRGHSRRASRYEDDARRASRHRRYDSPAISVRSRRTPSPEIDEYEERSVFCSQLSARLGQRDLGEFFEDHLGEGAVQDVRIVMDRVTHRSKGVGYVEFAARELVPKAIELTGKVLFGIPIVVQRTDAARNGGYKGSGDALTRYGMTPHPAIAAPQLDPRVLASAPLPMQYHTAGSPIHLNAAPPAPRAPRPGPNMPNTEARLYVGSLHFSLTDENVKAVFEPFGEIEYVDLHREPGTGKSKGFCFIQFKRAEDAKKALEQMNGFELAGRAIRVGNVNAKGTGSGGSYTGGAGPNSQGGGHLPQLTSAFDDGGGGGLNPERRAALMEKLARNNEASPTAAEATAVTQERPAGIPESTSTSLLLKNMFDPAE